MYDLCGTEHLPGKRHQPVPIGVGRFATSFGIKIETDAEAIRLAEAEMAKRRAEARPGYLISATLTDGLRVVKEYPAEPEPERPEPPWFDEPLWRIIRGALGRRLKRAFGF